MRSVTPPGHWTHRNSWKAHKFVSRFKFIGLVREAPRGRARLFVECFAKHSVECLSIAEDVKNGKIATMLANRLKTQFRTS